MSDLVERLRERGHTIMPPSVQEAIAIARKCERELRFIAQVSTRDLVGIVLADRIEELEGIVREALPILDGYEDCGPSGETWQSDELMALVAKARAALGE